LNPLQIVQADLNDREHQAAVLTLTRDYARDPMGDGQDLPPEAQARLIAGLQTHPTALILLAFDQQQPVAIATCFIGFSTFAARPLINIHDLHVAATHRRQGIGRRMLAAVEQKARALNCCKLTLEVQERNHPAQALYRSFGFAGGQYQAEAGGVLFRQKLLSP
jgi:ribosomal protein S18 acetylase RimI-like enzyme